MPDNLTEKEHWIQSYNHQSFTRYTDHGIDHFIKKYIPVNNTGTCFEIGSYPGAHLPAFGDLGYTLNGVDYHPDNCIGLPAWLKNENYKVGEFMCNDFGEFKTSSRYDVVTSFGFIEHFKDFESVILKHAQLVNDTGYVIITTPNFKGWIQNFLHRIFDRQNLLLHNVKSMNPAIWKSVLEKHGFLIIYAGYFGDFWFWHGHENLPVWKKKSLWIIERIISRLRKLLKFQSESFSAYAGIVAKRL